MKIKVTFINGDDIIVDNIITPNLGDLIDRISGKDWCTVGGIAFNSKQVLYIEKVR